MTPHPLATWVQLTVSPQRLATQRRARARVAAHVRLRAALRDLPGLDDETTVSRRP